MPTETKWLIPQRIIVTRNYGAMSMEDIRQSGEDIPALIAQGTPLVHVISDNRDVTSYPVNVNTMVKAIQSQKHPHTGWVILLTRNPLEGFVTSLVVQLLLSNVRIAHKTTIEEALTFIKDRDMTIALAIEDSAANASTPNENAAASDNEL